MTPLSVSIAGAIASFVLVLVVLELIRSRRLRERYALLWLATGIVLTVLSAWREGLYTIARLLGRRGAARDQERDRLLERDGVGEQEIRREHERREAREVVLLDRGEREWPQRIPGP